MAKKPKKLTPKALLERILDGFDKSGHTECQVLADMLQDHLENEYTEKGDQFDIFSVTLFQSMLDEVITNACAMKREIIDLKRELKS